MQGADSVYARKVPADVLPRLLVEFIDSPPSYFREQGVVYIIKGVEGGVIVGQGSDGRYIFFVQFIKEAVFLEYHFFCPAAGTVELGDEALLDAAMLKLIDAVDVAVPVPEDVVQLCADRSLDGFKDRRMIQFLPDAYHVFNINISFTQIKRRVCNGGLN